MKTLTDQQRIDIVRYRLKNALTTLKEVESHRENGFYNTAVNKMSPASQRRTFRY